MRLYIVGALAQGQYPQDLTSTTEEPLHIGGSGVRWRAARSVAWTTTGGRVKEFTAPYGGQRCIAREVTDPDLVAEVKRVEARVAEAEAALAAARQDRAQALLSVAMRSAPARVNGTENDR